MCGANRSDFLKQHSGWGWGTAEGPAHAGDPFAFYSEPWGLVPPPQSAVPVQLPHHALVAMYRYTHPYSVYIFIYNCNI